MERKPVKILGFDVDTFTFEESVTYAKKMIDGNSVSQVVTINPEIIEAAKKYSELAQILHEAELVTADGIGIKIGLKIKGTNAEKVTGVEFAHRLIKECAQNDIPIALIGAKDFVINKASENLKKEFANLNIVYAHDGYFDDNSKIINELNQTSAKLILVALGAPKQEKFIYEAKKSLHPSLMIGVGGSFDVWAGEVKRAPEIWQKLNLEWLYRTITQPSRFKRIFPTLPIFVYNIIKEKIKGV